MRVYVTSGAQGKVQTGVVAQGKKQRLQCPLRCAAFFRATAANRGSRSLRPHACGLKSLCRYLTLAFLSLRSLLATSLRTEAALLQSLCAFKKKTG